MMSNKRSHLLPSTPDGVAPALSSHPSLNRGAAQAPLQVAWRRRWTIVLTTILCLAAGVVYLLKATPEYTSSSKIYVEQPPHLLGDVQALAAQQGDSYLHTQAERIKSTPILTKALDALDAQHMKTFEKVDNLVTYLKRNLDVRVGKQDDLITVSFDSPYRE